MEKQITPAATTLNQTCSTCKHWIAHRSGFHYGECYSKDLPKITLSEVGPVEGGEFHNEDGEVYRDSDIELKRFITRQDFGCVFHQALEQAPAVG